MNKKLSVIIVAFNSETFIKKCLELVLKNNPEDSEVIVIDNKSTDNTKEVIKGFTPKVRFIESDKNLGFGKAVNLAAGQAQGKYLFLLNPDAFLKKPMIGELIDFYENTPNVGIVFPKLITLDGRVQPSVRKLPTIWGAIKEFIFSIQHEYTQYTPNQNIPVEIEAAYGAAALITKDLFLKLGGFDEKFFMYYEDVDLCRRIRNLGFKVYFYPNASIEHMVGGVISPFKRSDLNNQSLVKYHGFLTATILNLIFWVPRIKRRLQKI